MQILLCASFFLLTASVRAEEPQKKAVERGLDFLQKDVVKWKKERQCATCHHGTFTVWALAEAKKLGFTIPADSIGDATTWTRERLKDMDKPRDTRPGYSMVSTPALYLGDATTWTRERLKDMDKPRDTRPGYSMVSTPALYLALMAAALPEQSAISAEELKKIAGHLVRHQEADGSWSWASAPAKNRPPPVFESDEVATLLGFLALGPQVPADPKVKSEVRDARDKAAAWLAKAKPTNTTQTAALRLLVKVKAGEPAKTLQADIDAFLARRNKDGGWGQVPDAASDAYATGQALYVLSLAGVKPDTAEVKKGVAFLVVNQLEDGSWPMTRRGHEGVTPGEFKQPIIYFGSAWAAMGLMRSVVK